MILHTVRAGETLSAVGRQYGVDPGLVARCNGLRPPYPLAVGQSLLVLIPKLLHTVRAGESLWSIAKLYGTDPLVLLRCNPNLGGLPAIYPGQVLAVAWTDEPVETAECLGYAYPTADEATLRTILPYAAWLSPFTSGLTASGGLLAADADRLLALAGQYDCAALLHLSTLTESGGFSGERAAALLGDGAAQERLIGELAAQAEEKGYAGVDADFEYVGAPFARAYADFLSALRLKLHAQGKVLFAALAPKTSADQKGLLYEGHDYALVSAAVDAVLLMTYEWGYTYGPAGPVAPADQVRRVLEYALTVMPPEKIFLGFPNYAYDWTLPYRSGESRARSLSNEEAPLLAARVGAEIRWDGRAASPYFNYTADGAVHEVWFEDPRSAAAKYALVSEFGLRGVGVWNFMRPFPAAFCLLDASFRLLPGSAAAP